MLNIDVRDPEWCAEDMVKALVLQYSTVMSLGGVGAAVSVSETNYNTARDLDMDIVLEGATPSFVGQGTYRIVLKDPILDVAERLDDAFRDRDQPSRAAFITAANKLFGYELS